MFVIQVPAGVELQQIDMPVNKGVVPEGKKGAGNTIPFERSCQGSLHIRPSAVMSVTADELEFLKENHASLHKKLLVIKEIPSAAEEEAKASAPKADAPTEGDAPADTSDKPNAKKK